MRTSFLVREPTTQDSRLQLRARFYRLASDRFLTHQECPLVKTRESLKRRFADLKAGVRFNETLTESPSRLNVKE